MNLPYVIHDVPFAEVRDHQYSLGVFFIGYENRSNFLLTTLTLSRFENIVVLYIPSTNYDIASRISELNQGRRIKVLAIPDPKSIEFARSFESILSHIDLSRPIFVDYSAMPRQIYCDILNICRICDSRPISLIFSYAHGHHHELTRDLSAGEVYCLRGCEANISSTDRTVALIGLGFDDAAPLHLLDSIEPNEVYCFYASPGALDGYDMVAVRENASLLQLAAVPEHHVIPIPLASIETAFQMLYEVAAPYVSEANVIILPFGPKPHVLASILLSMSSPRISCLYADRKMQRASSITATGEVTCTRILLSERESDA